MRPLLWFANGQWQCALWRPGYGDMVPMDWTSAETPKEAYDLYEQRITDRHEMRAKRRANQ